MKQLESYLRTQVITYLSVLRNQGLLRFYRIYNGPVVLSTGFKGRGSRKVFRKNPSPGFPDLLIMPKDKQILFIELKTMKGRLSEDQVLFQDDCLKMGQTYFVWRSMEDAVATLKRFQVI